MSRYGVAVLAALLLAGFAVLGSPPPAQAAAGGASVPLGAAPKLPAGAVRVGTLPGQTVLHVDVVLAQRDPAGLQRFATQVSTPGSPLYRHYLDPGQVGGLFGPTTATVDAMATAMHRLGLTTGQVTPTRVLLPVTATAARLAAAFHTGFATYRLPGGRTAYANTSAARVPAAVAGDVTGIVGLDDLAVPHPQIARPHRVQRHPGATRRPVMVRPAAGPAPCTAARNAQTSWGAGLLINQIADSYQLSPLYAQGDLGAGQKVAVLELEPYTAGDVAAYQSCFGTSAPVSTVKVDGGATGGQSGEAALDIENIAGLAPRSAIIDYSAPDTGTGVLDDYARIVSDDVASVISTSWGLCEQGGGSLLSAENTVFQQAAAQGQSVFDAAGDAGSTDCYGADTSQTELSVDDPASQPFVTGVGGTSLNTLGPPPAETVWNNRAIANGAGGGGISTVWRMPAYQSSGKVPGVINSYSSRTPCKAPSGYCREVPDVSADANPSTGYFIYFAGTWQPYGGTSAAAPMWAAMTALINALPQCTTRLGFANPTLYAVAARPALGGFHDVKTGNNAYIPAAGAHYPATTGYDLATGIGTPSATALVAQTCQPAAAYHPVSPARLLDTRTGKGGTTGPVPARHTITLKVRGAGGVPAGATAVVLNLAATQAGSHGYLTAYPAGGARPTASSLNFTQGVTRANLTVVPIGSNGSISIYNGSDGTVQLVGDVFGYDSTAAGSRFTPAAPVRVMDTRTGLGVPGPVSAEATVTLPISGQHGVPAGATAVVLNVTVTGAQHGGWVAVWPAGTPEPLVSNLNFTAGQTTPNLVVVPIGPDGRISIHNGTHGTIQLVADQFGYYAPSGATSFTATTPTRLLDSRYGTGGVTGPVAARHTIKVKVAGVDGVPAGVKAVVLNVTETSATASGYVTVYPDGISRPLASNLNFAPGLTAPNLVIVPVSQAGYVDLYNGSSGSVQLIADCSGFYR